MQKNANNPVEIRESASKPLLQTETTKRTKTDVFWSFIKWLLDMGSGEHLLKSRPNSGTVIFVRSLLTTIIVYSFTILLKEGLAPDAIWWTINYRELTKVVSETLPWIGAIFAASYAALYTRFASQWAYLASLGPLRHLPMMPTPV